MLPLSSSDEHFSPLLAALWLARLILADELVPDERVGISEATAVVIARGVVAAPRKIVYGRSRAKLDAPEAWACEGVRASAGEAISAVNAKPAI